MSLPQGLTRTLLETRYPSAVVPDAHRRSAVQGDRTGSRHSNRTPPRVFNTFNSTPEERLADDHLQPEFRTIQRVCRSPTGDARRPIVIFPE